MGPEQDGEQQCSRHQARARGQLRQVLTHLRDHDSVVDGDGLRVEPLGRDLDGELVYGSRRVRFTARLKDSAAVLVNASGVLGTTTSSARTSEPEARSSQ